MIEKELRNGTDDCFNVIVTDKFNNSFRMLMGGNLDLYWLPINYNKAKSYYIDESDALAFEMFDKLFENINKIDGNGLNYPKTMAGNKFVFISEDFPEQEANRLEIIKENNQFVINFIKSENLGPYGSFRRGCAICFCNSGSRVPNVERQFMLMFNDLAYYSEDIEIIQS